MQYPEYGMERIITLLFGNVLAITEVTMLSSLHALDNLLGSSRRLFNGCRYRSGVISERLNRLVEVRVDLCDCDCFWPISGTKV